MLTWENIISLCAQSVHTIRILRTHGMCEEGMQTVFRSVVVDKLMYHAANAQWGFTVATDWQSFAGVCHRDCVVQTF